MSSQARRSQPRRRRARPAAVLIGPANLIGPRNRPRVRRARGRNPGVGPSVNAALHQGGTIVGAQLSAAIRRPARPRRSRAAPSTALQSVVDKESALIAARAQLRRAIANPFQCRAPPGGGTGGPTEQVVGTFKNSAAASGNTIVLITLQPSFKGLLTTYSGTVNTNAISTYTIAPNDAIETTNVAPTAAGGFIAFRALVGGLVAGVEDTSAAVYPSIYVGLAESQTNFLTSTPVELLNCTTTQQLPAGTRTAAVAWEPVDTMNTQMSSTPLTTGAVTTLTLVPWIMFYGVSASAVVSYTSVVQGDAVRGQTTTAEQANTGVSGSSSPEPDTSWSMTDLFRGMRSAAEIATGVYDFSRAHSAEMSSVIMAGARLYQGTHAQRRLRLLQAATLGPGRTFIVAGRPIAFTEAELRSVFTGGFFRREDLTPSDYRDLVREFDPDGDSLDSRLARLELHESASSSSLSPCITVHPVTSIPVGPATVLSRFF